MDVAFTSSRLETGCPFKNNGGGAAYVGVPIGLAPVYC